MEGHFFGRRVYDSILILNNDGGIFLQIIRSVLNAKTPFIMHHINQCKWNLVEKIIQYTQECHLPKIKLPDTQKLYHYITLDKKNTHCIELIHLRDWQVLDFKNPTYPIDYSKFNDSLHQIINTHPSLC